MNNRVEYTVLLLCAMIVLQAVWLGGIFWTKATKRLDKLFNCAVYCAIASLMVLLISWFHLINPTSLITRWGVGVFQGRVGIAAISIITAGVGYTYIRRQRIWPVDEQWIRYAARSFAKSGVRETITNYIYLPWLGMQHPPLIPWLGGILLRWFGDRPMVLRLLSLLFLIGSLLVTYQIGVFRYGTSTGLLAALSLMVFPLIWRLGSAAMLDVPVTFWFGLTMLIVLRIPDSIHNPIGLAALAGAVICLGLLTRYTMILIYPVLLALAFTGQLSWSALISILLVSASLFSIWLLFAYRYQILRLQINRLLVYSGRKSGSPAPRPQSKGLLGALGVTRQWRMRLRLETLVNRLPSALGTYSLAILLVGIRQIYLNSSPIDIILVIWSCIPFTLLLMLLPDHRYFLPIFPSLALIMARGLTASDMSAFPVIILALLFCAGDLYLFVDWHRQTYMFSRDGI
jgi:4-amino-4-deoxy-L-arabinose transferase-like glycosyltransferase